MFYSENNQLIRIQNKCLDFTQPKVMGILNTTPDSFYDGGRWNNLDIGLRQAEQMLEEGADIIDIGGVSSKPGAEDVDEQTEHKRTIPIIKQLIKRFPDTIISIDTYRASIAKAAVEAGASIINDISAGSLDAQLLPTVAQLGVPYILMHMQGQPKTMQKRPIYKQVAVDIFDFLNKKMLELQKIGIHDIIIDVGFGFGKSIDHNYQLLNHTHLFQQLGAPILVGISRKSMIWKALNSSPQEALNGTTALHMVALQQGAKILRVHDVKAAKEVVALWTILNKNK